MKLCRLLPVLFLVIAFSLCTCPVWAGTPISGRKIGPITVANIEGDAKMVSPDDRWLAFGWSEEGTGIRSTLFDRRTHKSWIPELEMVPIAFSHNGRSLFVWCYEPPLSHLPHRSDDARYIAVYNPARRRFSRVFPGTRLFDSSNDYLSGFLSKDGATLTIVTREDQIYGFNTRTGKLKWHHQLPSPKASNSDSEEEGSPILSNDGKRFLRNRDGYTAQQSEVVDTRSGKVLARLRISYANPNGARPVADEGRLAPRGPMAATYFPGTQEWFFWNTHTSHVCWKMGGPSRITTGDLSWQFSPDGRTVCVFGPKGFQVRDARTGRILKQNKNLHADTVAFSPDGKKLYALGEGSDFEHSQMLWQWRFFGTRRQCNADRRIMRNLQRSEEQFALSPRHLNQSLTIAARRGDPARVALLLGKGAYIETRDRDGDTPLESAMEANNVYGGPQRSLETAELLIAHGANVNAGGGSILANAANKSDQLTQLLLDHGANPNGHASHYGSCSALHTAVNFGQLRAAQLLVAHGANVNMHRKDGVTPLLDMLDSNFTGTPANTLRLAKLLIDHGANVNAQTQKTGILVWGKTPLMEAAFAYYMSPDVVRFLLEHGAHPDIRDSNGETALMWVAKWNAAMSDSMEPAEESREITVIKLLVKHGANVNLRSKAGETALSLAATPTVKAALRKLGAHI